MTRLLNPLATSAASTAPSALQNSNHLLTAEFCDDLCSWDSFDQIQQTAEPLPTSSNRPTYVFGDMHGNVIRLIALLSRIHYIEALTQDQFETLVHLYDRAETKNKFRVRVKRKSHDSADFSIFYDKFKEILKFNTLILQNSRLILIGDILCDRGKSDIMMLELLRWMHENNVNFSIILSNHDLQFLHLYENRFDQLFVDEYRRLWPDLQFVSTFTLLQADDLVKQRMINVVETVYLPRLRLVDYNITQTQQMYVYSHTRLDINLLNRMTAHPPVAASEMVNIPLPLIKSQLDTLNQQFSALQRGSLFSQLKRNVPLHSNFVWDRHFNGLIYPANLLSVFGHVGTACRTAGNFINVDESNLGKRQIDSHSRQWIYYNSGNLIVLRVFNNPGLATNLRPVPSAGVVQQSHASALLPLIQDPDRFNLDDDDEDDDTFETVDDSQIQPIGTAGLLPSVHSAVRPIFDDSFIQLTTTRGFASKALLSAQQQRPATSSLLSASSANGTPLIFTPQNTFNLPNLSGAVASATSSASPQLLVRCSGPGCGRLINPITREWQCKNCKRMNQSQYCSCKIGDVHFRTCK